MKCRIIEIVAASAQLSALRYDASFSKRNPLDRIEIDAVGNAGEIPDGQVPWGPDLHPRIDMNASADLGSE
ncbi:hypothetical protein CR51_00060 [Caballeronia megalochromosomata]|nr:hypothetical protein CR51_00060 [Caballeronia megalochromosomata]